MIEERSASIIVCDDFFYSIAGKVTLSGVYVQDIVIPASETTVNQLVFFFTIETPKERPFKSLTLKIQFPGSEPILAPVVIMPRMVGPEDPLRKKITIKQPMLVQQVVLRPGRIRATALHDEGELDAGGIWIALQSSASPLTAQPET